jgi:nucleoside-diphosphate-sugar epimerase
MARKLIFVTGGTGFLGRHLVAGLLRKNYRVRTLVRPLSDDSWLKQNGVEIVWGDVTDFDSVVKGIERCDCVVHAAGFFRFWGPKEVFFNVNVNGTRNICEAAYRSAVKRVIHISTIVVIGEPKTGQIIDEMTVCAPKDHYQKSKLAGEYIVKEFVDKGLEAIILRPGAFYGPYGRYAFNRLFIEEPLRGWRVQVDKGRRYTFPVFVPDVTQAICNALDRGYSGEIYNISDHSISHRELNRMISSLAGISHWRLNVPSQIMIALASIMEGVAKITRREPFYPLNLRHYVFNDWKVSSIKAQKQLGFKPTPLKDGLKETISWYSQVL